MIDLQYTVLLCFNNGNIYDGINNSEICCVYKIKHYCIYIIKGKSFECTRVPLDVINAANFCDGNRDFFNVIGHALRSICSVLFRAQAMRPRRDRENYQVIAIGYFDQFESSFPKLDQLSLDSAEFRLCVALST